MSVFFPHSLAWGFRPHEKSLQAIEQAHFFVLFRLDLDGRLVELPQVLGIDGALGR